MRPVFSPAAIPVPFSWRFAVSGCLPAPGQAAGFRQRTGRKMTTEKQKKEASRCHLRPSPTSQHADPYCAVRTDSLYQPLSYPWVIFFDEDKPFPLEGAVGFPGCSFLYVFPHRSSLLIFGDIWTDPDLQACCAENIPDVSIDLYVRPLAPPHYRGFLAAAASVAFWPFVGPALPAGRIFSGKVTSLSFHPHHIGTTRFAPVSVCAGWHVPPLQVDMIRVPWSGTLPPASFSDPVVSGHLPQMVSGCGDTLP